MRKSAGVFILISVICLAFSGGSHQPIIASWPQPHFALPASSDSSKIELGRILFYDPVLSADNSISCASCHSPYNAFAHTDHALSHGIHDSIGMRNAPALFNLAWQNSFMWDGAVHHIDMQALAPITHPGEMGESMANVIRKISNKPGYAQLYRNAYADSTVTGSGTLKALSAFMLSLVSNNSRYDSVMRSQQVFQPQELKGYEVYRNHCASCHAEPLFSSSTFRNNGLTPDTTLQDTGRKKITGESRDAYRFKVPSLRNLDYTYPYMHDGRFKKLSEVIHHYTTDATYKRGEFRRPIVISETEKRDLIAFLLTLNDRNFIFNKNHHYPAARMKALAGK